MHELSIALQLIDQVQELAHQRNVHVVAVQIQVGELSGVVCEALQSAWELARKATSMSEVKLDIEAVEAVGYCGNCQRETEIASIQLHQCLQCGNWIERIIRGHELDIIALQVET
ncbi:hydrogenase maturation nickel metallochaperone HypA/HybF [Thalassoroseus pseudoceratinae]|uniref:hydrogenase maturation nickel metallochaperone HypA/HybF n=1 Tax=Thalassoroseus pseudoceratinae TaxID=2713176 RepID=UPI00141EF22A|nr:hydrogenase maturation nickel metallochaperone HypA [Thalassoroseus pseudoceratinae]